MAINTRKPTYRLHGYKHKKRMGYKHQKTHIQVTWTIKTRTHTHIYMAYGHKEIQMRITYRWYSLWAQENTHTGDIVCEHKKIHVRVTWIMSTTNTHRGDTGWWHNKKLRVHPPSIILNISTGPMKTVCVVLSVTTFLDDLRGGMLGSAGRWLWVWTTQLQHDIQDKYNECQQLEWDNETPKSAQHGATRFASNW